MTFPQTPRRAEGRRAMVASGHPLATSIGLAVLRDGGSAADAAVAVNAALNVTQPCFCGIGGDFFCLYYHAATGKVSFLNGGGRSGSGASIAELRRRGLDALPKMGPESVSVPGCVKAWQMLLERFGTKPLSQLLAPAIELAFEGFEITPVVCRSIEEMSPAISDPYWRAIFLPYGRPPKPGNLFFQPELGRALAQIVQDGADAFYKGEIAESIARRLAHGGFVRLEDLERHEGEWGEPLAAGYRGYTVLEPPPPTPGIAVLLTLKIFEGFDPKKLSLQSGRHLWALIEASKAAYSDQKSFLAAPGTAQKDVARLLSAKHVDALRAKLPLSNAPTRDARQADPIGDTTGFVIVDEQGNMISAIQSIFSAFGSGIVAPDTGIVLHNRGNYFSMDESHPNALAPHKRPFHTLIAAMVLERGHPVLGFSTMGANGQAQQIHSQVLTNVLDYGLDPQDAIERPRFIIGPPNRPADLLWMESRMERAAVAELQWAGYRIENVGDYFSLMGHAQAVALRGKGLIGAADPRGDGQAMGY